MKKIFWSLTLILGLLLTSCGGSNLYTKLSDKTSDEALYQSALQEIDSSNWAGAIAIITNQLSATYQKRQDVRETLMGAYAGKCGLNFVNLVNSLSTASGGIFSIAISGFGGVIVDAASCDSAQAVLQGLGTALTRTSNENVYGAILGLTKAGVNLHRTLDQENNGAGNGIVDAGFDVCTTAASTTTNKLTDAQVAKIIVGVGLIFENLATLTASFGTNSGISALNSAQTQCENAAGGPGTCTITDESIALSNPTLLRLFRRMISSSELGIGTCSVTAVSVPPSCCPGISFP